MTDIMTRRSIPDWRGVGIDRISVNLDEVVLRATHNGRTCFVYLDLTPSGEHHCSCQDDLPRSFAFRLRGPHGMFCKHILASAMAMNLQAVVLPHLIR